MKNKKLNQLWLAVVLGVVFLIASSCERDLSEEVEFATFSKTGEIFIDDFIGVGNNFYFPFVTDGAKADVFSVDGTEGYESAASIRIDVPNADDPNGNFAGASFVIDGAGRNLTEYDALTFWAKSSQAATIGSIGFGLKFRAARTNLKFTTSWTKFIIPIPDPSKLLEIRSVFEFAAGGIGPEGQEVGYSFWIDDLKFEKLGTIAHPRPSILNGNDLTEVGFNGGSVAIGGYNQTFNLANGQNVTVNTTPAYFNFISSNSNVGSVNSSGNVTIVGAGTATISASLAGVEAEGSLIVESLGNFIFAPTPNVPAEDVISIFSDAYNNRQASLISNFGAFQSSTLRIFESNGQQALNYQNVNFFGIEFNQGVDISTINGTEMTTLHMDIFIPADLNPGANLRIELRNAGPNGIVETDQFSGQPVGDDTQVSTSPPLVAGQWISVDFPITALADRSALAQIVFVAPAAGPSNFYVDNIYLYR